MAARADSASTRSPKPVDPPRSQNIAVTVLRTASAGAAVGVAAEEGGAAATGVPQLSQNRASVASARAQAAHRRISATPQDAQNEASSRRSAPHALQCTPAPSARSCRA